MAIHGRSRIAHDESGSIADAIEADKHPFFAGIQGHHELSSRNGSPFAGVARCQFHRRAKLGILTEYTARVDLNALL
ncbi:hypothetical protein A9R05_27495 [Burkholderia sp. KK1]|nr:hypothetical protein A9R05_27495 [Burkholderia sp. KK1]